MRRRLQPVSFSSTEHDGVALRRRQESFGGFKVGDGRRGPVALRGSRLRAFVKRFATYVCESLGPPPPNNCDEDMVSLAKQYADHAMEYRWNEKATPDGIDYYAALGAVRDSDNDTLVSSYARVSLELQEPLELFERLLANAQKLRERAAP